MPVETETDTRALRRDAQADDGVVEAAAVVAADGLDPNVAPAIFAAGDGGAVEALRTFEKV